MAPEEARMIAPRPRPRSPRTARYSPQPMSARATPGSLMDDCSASPDSNAWKTKKPAKLPARPTTRAVAANTTVFASRTYDRRGTAARVARIIPVVYSLVMISTPKTPSAICDRWLPPRLTRTASSVALSCSLSRPGRKTASSAAKPIMKPTAAISDQVVERTERSLQNSDRRMSANSASRVCWSAGTVSTAMETSGSYGRGCRLALWRVEICRCAGELEVDVLQRAVVNSELLQGQRVGSGNLADRVAGE